MAKNATILCPNCSTALQVETGIWGKWKPVICPQCQKRVAPENVRKSVVHCDRCNRDVAVDLLGNGKMECPICHNALLLPSQKAMERDVVCPYCKMEAKIDGGFANEKVLCEFCGMYYDVEKGVREFKHKKTEFVMRIANSDGMKVEDVLWRHTASFFSVRSTVELQPGTVALLVDGNRCIDVVERSGETIQDHIGAGIGGNVSLSVVFVRQNLNRQVLFGCGKLRIYDENYVIKSDARISTHGYLNIRISDVKTFAQKVGFRNCTEADIGLRMNNDVENIPVNAVYPQVGIDTQGYLDKACSAVLQSTHCGIHNLREHMAEISEEFADLAQKELKSEWGMEVTRCSIEGLGITNEMLEARDAVLNAVARSFNWGPIMVTVYMNNNQEYRATIRASGSFQMRVSDRQKLQKSDDWGRWNREPQQAEEAVIKYVGDYIKGVLPSVIQGTINRAEADIRSLPNYNHGIVEQIRERFAREEAAGYLFNHGMQIDMIAVDIDIYEMSDALARYYAVKEKGVTGGLDVEEANIAGRTKVEVEKAKTEAETQVEMNALSAKDQLAQKVHESEMARKRREDENKTLERDLAHKNLMAEMRNKEEEQKLSDQNRFSGAVRDKEYEQFADNTEREREKEAQQHEKLMTEIMLSIEQSKLSFQEKLDEYARVKQLQDTLNEADQRRNAAQGEADVRRINSVVELQLSDAAQKLMDQAAQAAQEREENKKNAQFERDMKLRRETMEAELEKLRLQEQIRNATRESEERISESRAEVEKLKIMLNCYQEQMKYEADAARAEAAAERARKDAEREYGRRERERQEQRSRQNREREDRQREQQNEDRKHLEKMLVELTHLQSEIARCMKPSADKPNDSLDRMAELTRAVQDMLAQLGKGANYAPQFGYEGQNYGGYGRNISDYDRNGNFQPRRQPGIRNERQCPFCGTILDSRGYCITCGKFLN